MRGGGRAVVQRGRDALVATGMATFPGFLAADALAAAAAEARAGSETRCPLAAPQPQKQQFFFYLNDICVLKK